MKALSRSDLWFGVFLAALFALVSFVFFGRAVADPAFWSRLLPILGCTAVIILMRAPLEKLDRIPRAVSWFSIGATTAMFVAFSGGHELSLAIAVGFGLAFTIFDFVADNYLRKKDGDPS